MSFFVLCFQENRLHLNFIFKVVMSNSSSLGDLKVFQMFSFDIGCLVDYF